ncbi:unnamed protein product [Miscanthus lutarioriparius]|uniref:glutathione transferase n=1 Tax=Miscanthus lutarioriparius TaxID=422564 RepID=A0A811RXF5_9POAL|nr:unnamed protein product [Miscanthus lutarioriparius]
MAVKLYGWSRSPFVSRALLCLEEAGVDYELVPMNKEAGDHRRPDHIARNPFGQVPVLEDGDLTVFESRAIGKHVLRKYKPELLGAGSLEDTAMVEMWLEVEAHQHHPAAGAIAHECIAAPALLGRMPNQAIIDENVEKLKKVLEVYETRLSKCRYLAGDFLSLADLSHFTVMHYFMATEYAALVEAHPHVKAWWEELAARPAAKKVAGFLTIGSGVTTEK